MDAERDATHGISCGRLRARTRPVGHLDLSMDRISLLRIGRTELYNEYDQSVTTRIYFVIQKSIHYIRFHTQKIINTNGFHVEND